MPRPTKFNEVTMEKIFEAIKVGATPTTAGKYAGVSRETIWRWVKRGDRGQAEYREFARRFHETQASLVVLLLAVVDKAAMKGDWKAAAWKLARIDRKEYGSMADAPAESEAPKQVEAESSAENPNQESA